MSVYLPDGWARFGNETISLSCTWTVSSPQVHDTTGAGALLLNKAVEIARKEGIQASWNRTFGLSLPKPSASIRNTDSRSFNRRMVLGTDEADSSDRLTDLLFACRAGIEIAKQFGDLIAKGVVDCRSSFVHFS